MFLRRRNVIFTLVALSALVALLLLSGCAGTATPTEAPAEQPEATEAPAEEETMAEEEETMAEDEEAMAEEEEAMAEEEEAMAEDLSGTLRVSAPPWIFLKFPLEEIGQRFEEDHPDVTVEFTRVDKWNVSAYITEWKGGDTSVDVYVGGSGSMLAPVIAGDWSEPMDDMLTGHMAPDEFVGGFLAAGHYKRPDGEGSYYPVLPFMGEVAIIGVNTAIAEQAGLMDGSQVKPIPSFEEEEFLGWFRSLGEYSETGAHVQIWDREFMQYNYCAPIIAMTGECFTDQGFDVSSDAAKQWLSLVQRMNEEGLGEWAITDDEGYDKWKTNKAGSFFAAQGHIMELVNAVTNEEDSIAYTSWPGEGGSVIWTHSVWIPKVSPNKELGKAFIREQIFSPHFQQWSFNNYGKLPVMADYYGEGIERFQDQMDIILGVADASQPVPLYTDMQEYLDILVIYLTEAAFGRMEVDAALQAVQNDTADLDFTDLRAPMDMAPPEAAAEEEEEAMAEEEEAMAEEEEAMAEEEEAMAEDLSGTLRVSAPPWIFLKFPLEEIGQRFEEDHPDVTVEFTRVDKWNVSAYITEWKGGDTSVDVYVGGSGSMLAPVIAGDWSEPMDDMLTGHMAPDEFVGGFLAAGHYKRPDGEGSYYPVLPFMGEVAIIGVNTAIAEQAGLMDGSQVKPIPSFEEEEFLGWFRSLGEYSETGAHVQIWDREFMQYNYCAPIIAMTGECFTDQGFDVSSDAAKQWLSLVQRMNEEGLGEWAITDDEGYDKWKTNKAGSFFAAQGHIMELVNAVTNEEDSIAYTSWPGEGGSVIWTHSVWIPKVSPNKELGKAFIREQIFSPHFQQWSFNNYGKLPVMADYYGEGIERFQDQMDIILGVADASQPVPLYTDMQEYLDILVIYLTEAAFGRMEVDAALQAVQNDTADLDFTDLRAQ